MDTVPHEAFGELLRRYRRTAGLTQEELADRAGISADTISNIERGMPHMPRKDTLRLLAQALNLAEQESESFLAVAREAQAHARNERLSRAQPGGIGATLSPVPMLPTPLVGRERELADAQTVLQTPSIRLLTITGVGGVGKTQFAFALAHAVQPSFADGIHVVYLAPLRDPGLLPAAMAGTLGLHEAGTTSFYDLLLQHLQAKSMLLLLDNFEHLMPAATLISDLLAACAHLKILVTSRSPLHLRGEHEYPLAPLALPSPAETASPVSLAAVPSVELFLQRSRAVRPGFTLDAGNAAAIAAICQRLDGLPLAIELAAARSKMLSPQALLARLDEARLPTLTSGPRDLPARQRTLRDTLAWSYELLPIQARAVFRRLSVFAGGCRLDAVEAVCEPLADTASEPVDIFEMLATLVDHSLLRYLPEYDDANARFLLLEIVREYGWELLNTAGESQATQHAHASWCVDLALRAEEAMRGNERVPLTRMDEARDNMRAALTWSLNGGDVVLGLRLASAMWSYWSVRGQFSEGRHWLTSMLDAAAKQLPNLDDAHAPGDDMAALLAKTYYGIGALARLQGDLDVARAVYPKSLALREQLGDRRAISHLLSAMGAVEAQAGNTAVALDFLEQSLAIKRELGDQHGIAVALTSLGLLHLQEKHFDQAAAASEECIAVSGALGNSTNLSWGKSILAQVEMQRGNSGLAEKLALESLELRRTLGDRRGTMNSLGILGEIRQRGGDPAGALDLYQQVLDLAVEIGVLQGILEVLTAVASVYGEMRRYADGVRLIAATTALRNASGLGIQVGPAEQERGILDGLRAALEPAEFAEAWAEGEALTLDEIQEMVRLSAKAPATVYLPARRATNM